MIMTMLEFINKYHEGYRPEKIKIDLGFGIILIYEKNKSDLYFNIDNGEEITNDLSIFACLLDDNTKVEVIEENNKIKCLDKVPSKEELMFKINEIIDKVNKMEE